MLIITIVINIPITKHPEQDRLAENQPTAGLNNLNENEMRRSETDLLIHFVFIENGSGKRRV